MKDSKKTTQNDLVIFRGQKRAGILSRIENGCQFTYDPEFLTDPEYAGLSFKMPKWKAPVSVQGTNLHPFFAGLLPEGLRLRALVRALKTSEDDLFTLFASAGSRVIGDVYVKNKDHDLQNKSLPMPFFNQINFYEYFNKTILAKAYSDNEDALAGVQEKISASMISFPVSLAKKNRSYILKLNPKDIDNLVQNEWHCMTLASKCGIEVPNVKLIYDQTQNAGLLVERFDRQWDNDEKKVLMLHQEDACQFLGRYPADKYNLGYSEIASGIQEIATSPRASLLKFLKHFSFCYAIGNGDFHAKNISVLTQANSKITDLSPGYDLLTTFIYSDQKMSNQFDGKMDNITRKMILAFGKRFDVSEKATTRMLDKLIQDLEKNIHILESIPMEQKKQTSFKKMIAKRISDLSA